MHVKHYMDKFEIRILLISATLITVLLVEIIYTINEVMNRINY